MLEKKLATLYGAEISVDVSKIGENQVLKLAVCSIDDRFALDNEKIVATAAIIYDKDPNYDIIYEGKWITDLPYVVIHRIATKQEYRNKGYASKIIELTKEEMENVLESVRQYVKFAELRGV